MAKPILITPVFVGSGRAAHAIAKSLLILGEGETDFHFAPAKWLTRGTVLAEVRGEIENLLLVIANPHGLHARVLTEADAAGFTAISCEKPSVVRVEDVTALRKIKARVAVLHVYRQMWGPQTLKTMISAGEFGEIVAVEGRYWQSSAAERALATQETATDRAKNWKNSIDLSGEYDVFLDIATHWADVASFLIGETPRLVRGWRSHSNAEAPHRDTHVQLHLAYAKGPRAQASISKNYHGAGNHFEVHVLGSKKSASWTFQTADEITIGEGREKKILLRKTSDLGSRLSPAHGMGWVEGYIEIHRQLVRETFFKERSVNYPRLPENLDLMSALLKTDWSL